MNWITEIRREACSPTQFYARTSDGRYLFGHYRHGILSLGISLESFDDAVRNEIWRSIDDGTGRGDMAIEEFLSRTREIRDCIGADDGT
jgi:hypothetical protein